MGKLAGEAVTVDGRRARAERNRDSVVEAILGLLREGVDNPNVTQIAERSGVSVRSVFRHFDDLESLYTAAIEVRLQQVGHLFALEVPEGPTVERIAALAAQRAKLFENIAPIRRAAERRRRSSPAIDQTLGNAHKFLRHQVKECFEPELSRADALDRDDLVDALDFVTSWVAWEALRVEQGLSAARARGVLTLQLSRLLA